MKKKYVVEFKLADSSTDVVEFITEDLEWSIDQWSRNRAVLKYTLLETLNTSPTKKMLLG